MLTCICAYCKQETGVGTGKVRDFASLLAVFRDYFPRSLHAFPLLDLIHAGEKLSEQKRPCGGFS